LPPDRRGGAEAGGGAPGARPAGAQGGGGAGGGAPARSVLTFRPASPDPFFAYAAGLAAGFCGLRAELLEADDRREHVDVYHGDDRARPCGIRIPRVPAYLTADVPRVPPTDVPANAGEPFPFDLFSALRFWLADEGNARAPEECFDRHDRLIGERSAQEAAGVREIPVVNAYLLLFRAWAQARLGIGRGSLLPEGKRCVVVLSHDVDRPLDPTDLRPTLRLAASSLRRRPLRAPAYAGIAVAQALVAAARHRGARRWVFKEVAAAEEERGFRSTFFFAATSRFQRRGSYWDVAYDVSGERYRRVCRELAAGGSEIGLHAGYGARDRQGQLEGERRLIEEVAGQPVLGTRHHFWHMARPFWPTLEAHAAAGLGYDTSVAFNEVPGFRLGAALPFRPWNPERQRAIPLVEIPTMAMDGAFFYREGTSVESAVAEVERLVGVLKRSEGTAALDWHQEASFPAPGPLKRWGEAYLAVLDLLAADPEVSVQPCRAAMPAAIGGEPA
jgi:peptidoglycan/xylan/chitin deacetylase (PgdA/CDA1 family)